MYRNPYFAHLPTRNNRQDLAHALDQLPQLIINATAPTHHAASHKSSCSYSAYLTPPTSPSSTSTPTSAPWATPSPSHPYPHSYRNHFTNQQEQYQHQLIRNHLYVLEHNNDNSTSNPHHYPSNSYFLQFLTRAQAMAFLIQILQSLQQPRQPSIDELDSIPNNHHYNRYFEEEEEEEDHTGRVPCYICGEWYLELEPRKHGMASTSQMWHEQGSLRHQVAESRVRSWLDMVVDPSLGNSVSSHSQHTQPQPQPQSQPQSQQHTYHDNLNDEIAQDHRQPSRRHLPSHISIPQEILDPSCRSPGFRIKSSARPHDDRHDDDVDGRTLVSTPFLPSPLPDVKEGPKLVSSDIANVSKLPSSSSSSTTTSTFRFSFTSSRFKEAILHQASCATTLPSVVESSVADALTNCISHPGVSAEPTPDLTFVMSAEGSAERSEDKDNREMKNGNLVEEQFSEHAATAAITTTTATAATADSVAVDASSDRCRSMLPLRQVRDIEKSMPRSKLNVAGDNSMAASLSLLSLRSSLSPSSTWSRRLPDGSSSSVLVSNVSVSSPASYHHPYSIPKQPQPQPQSPPPPQ
ncbi:hypothetical protein BGZ94_010304 [Podila epigama]|nr:hypothetical protein BGZ94_010304 [Podila epigama]